LPGKEKDVSEQVITQDIFTKDDLPPNTVIQLAVSRVAEIVNGLYLRLSALPEDQRLQVANEHAIRLIEALGRGGYLLRE
jgi:hypothetical protein